MQISNRRDDPRRTPLGGAFTVIYVTSEENRRCYATRDVKLCQPAKFQNDRTTFIFYRQRYRPTLNKQSWTTASEGTLKTSILYFCVKIT